MATNQNDIIAATDEQQAGGARLVGGNGDDLLIADGTQSWTATLVSLNNSGVAGTVTATLAGDQLQVNVQATGLEPNQTHPMHIHGLIGDTGAAENSTLGAFDSDADGFVELAEGAATIGEPLLDLQSGGQFPTAAADGSLNFTATFALSDLDLPSGTEVADLFPLDMRAVQIHGDTVAAGDGILTGGEVDGTAGYKAALPVAAAEFVEADADATAAEGAVLRGDNGNDHLIGGAGDDLLLGSRGDDVLAGQGGDDLLVGGTGRDTFIVGDGTDTVVDFERNLDKLVFSDGTGPGGVQASSTSEGVQLTSGDNIVLLVGVQANTATLDLVDWIA